MPDPRIQSFRKKDNKNEKRIRGMRKAPTGAGPAAVGAKGQMVSRPDFSRIEGYTPGVVRESAQAKKQLAAGGLSPEAMTELQARIAKLQPVAKAVRAERLEQGLNVFGGEGRAQGTPQRTGAGALAAKQLGNLGGRTKANTTPPPGGDFSAQKGAGVNRIGSLRGPRKRPPIHMNPMDAGPRGAGSYEQGAFNRPLTQGGKGSENAHNVPGFGQRPKGDLRARRARDRINAFVRPPGRY